MEKRIGLVLGKFEVFHKGHESLIRFAKNNCDTLYVLLCSNPEIDDIPYNVRLDWLNQCFKNDTNIKIKHTDINLPYTSESSREVSKVWSNYIMKILPDVNIIFTSEKYGEYCAEYMNIEHMYFDPKREQVPISSSKIKSDTMKYFDYIVDSAKPYFVKKICICGSESTGKTTLCEYLAQYFKTNYVDECARDIINNTYNSTEDMLQQIILARANDMKEKIKHSNRMIFSDTDLYTTLSYSQYLFHKDLIVPEWIVEQNKFNLYLFLNHDAPYVQDGTRLSYEDRISLGEHHLKFFKDKGLNIQNVDGVNWEERNQKAILLLEKFLYI